MKLFVNDDIRAIELKTLSSESITERTIVERVAAGAAREISLRWLPGTRTVVFAGPGNNGADALATSMELIGRGFKPIVYLFNIGGSSLKNEALYFRNLYKERFPDSDFHEVTGMFNTPELGPGDLVIDGLFGSGLKDGLSGGFMSLVRYINESGAQVVSIDLPSGMVGDWDKSLIERNVIHATMTLAIEVPRISFFFPDKAELAGEIKVIDVGLSREEKERRPTNYYMVDEQSVRTRLKPRGRFCSKADFGSALIVSGRYGMMGASVMACRGAVRAGAGKVTLYGPQCGFPIVQTAVPEAMFESDDNKLVISGVKPQHPYTACGIGPGIGTNELTVNAVETFIKSSNNPLVIDADALNAISRRPDILNNVPAHSLLTPHEGEFDRLFGECDSRESRVKKAIDTAKYYAVFILLKGHYTTLICPDGKLYFNTTGCSGMATPGAGDVLTGILTALMAQGYNSKSAAIIGAYIHGLAGEMAQKKHGEYGVTASDIADHVGEAIQSVFSSQKR